MRFLLLAICFLPKPKVPTNGKIGKWTFLLKEMFTTQVDSFHYISQVSQALVLNNLETRWCNILYVELLDDESFMRDYRKDKISQLFN